MRELSRIPGARAFETWLRARPGLARVRVLEIRPLDGGASNITCRVRLAGAPWESVALRVQRDRGIFEPYDVLREGRVLELLAPSSVPVPRVHFVEPSPNVLGGPFLVLEWLDAPHMGEAGADADFGAYTRMVARIHSLDWSALGLGALGVPPSAREATLGEVAAIVARMPAFGCDDVPLLARAATTLAAAAPEDGELRFCQGDINVFNYLFRNREVAGVVDWEQARIGDCRSDVGQLVALSHLKGAPWGPAAAMPFVQAYETAASRALPHMEYFRALWAFELAVIYHGWVAFNGNDPWFSRDTAYALLEASLTEV